MRTKLYPRMPSSTILVTGANGQLGMELKRLAKEYPAYNFVFAGRHELSIDDRSSVRDYFKQHQPAWCINCAAYTAVDKAETEKEEARRINAEAAGVLAEACREHKTVFIHISTDYVFDGTSSTPYKEEDIPHPLNYYGESKLLGEQLVLQKNPNAIIIRTSWVYSEYGNNFVKTMIRLMKDRDILNVVNDQTGSPTYAADLAKVIMQIGTRGMSSMVSGVFHYSNEGAITWYEFAVAIKELTGSKCSVNPISSSQYPTPAKRPQFSLLDKTRIQSVLKITIPHWKDSLQHCLARLQIPPNPSGTGIL